jgi:hypothetical protein
MIRFGACFGEFVVVMFAAAKARVEGMKAAKAPEHALMTVAPTSLTRPMHASPHLH